MLDRYYGDVNHSPVADDAEEGLQCALEVHGRTAADYHGGDGAEGNQSYSWDAEGPGAEVLRVQRERVVVGDVVLWLLAMFTYTERERVYTGTALSAPKTIKNLPNPPAGSSATFKNPPTPAA